MFSSIRGVRAIDPQRRCSARQPGVKLAPDLIIDHSLETSTEGGDVRDAFRQIPGAVALVTIGTGDQTRASIATSIAPLSIEPPALILCLASLAAKNGNAPGEGQRIGVSLLSAQHGALAELCAGSWLLNDLAGAAGVGWTTLPQGSAVIEDAFLAFDCTIDDIFERRGQAVVIAGVAAMRGHPSACALIYWRGHYDRIGWTGAEIARATGGPP